MGLWAARVERVGDIADSLREALEQDGPALLDLSIEGSYPEHETA
jgi:thiamine pyrophosphate-dependent acetolactate synthase large subunit-like protein